MMLALATLTASGQTAKERKFDQRLFDAKVAQIAQKLGMSDDKRQSFTPIYKEYSEQMIKTWNKLAPSSDDKMARLKAGIRRQEQSQAIRLKYVDRFAKVLTPDEIGKLYKTEGDIQHQLKNRKMRSKKKR